MLGRRPRAAAEAPAGEAAAAAADTAVPVVTKRRWRTVGAPRQTTLSGYMVFLREQHRAGTEEVRKCATFRDKSRMITKLWNEMPEAAKQEYAAKGSKLRVVPHAEKLTVTKQGNGWQAYVKANYGKVKQLPFKKRLPAIAKLWEKK